MNNFNDTITKLCITVDVEEDGWSDYLDKKGNIKSVETILSIQKIFDRYGPVPTYLITYPVAHDEKACSVLREVFSSGKCEIGTHCHPWNTPPFDETPSNAHSMLCNLPDDIVNKKIETLHHEIEDRFDFSPVCFRAGRWGFNKSIARCLSDLGYKVDSSITPFIDWSDDSGPDFSNCSPFVRRLDGDENTELLEVPPTIGFLQKNFKLSQKIRSKIIKSSLPNFHLLGMLDRMKILNLRWLSPETSSGHDMIRLAERHIKNGGRFLNMIFHSTSLVPGLNPFVKKQTDLGRFYKRIEIFLRWASEKGCEFVPMGKAPEYFYGSRKN